MWNLRKQTNKTKTDSDIQRTSGWLQEGRRMKGGQTRYKGIERYKPPFIK